MWRVASTAAALALSVLTLSAQSGRSYGPGRIWWDAGQGGALPWEETYDNPDGQVGIFNRTGAIRTDRHPFFESLGSNRRACVTCHQPANAMSVSAASLRERWIDTQGKDPVFAAVDGSNCPNLPQESVSSHSLLIEKGLFRIALPWPPPRAVPDFRIEVVRDPTGCNKGGTVSVYRRPRMAANLDSVAAFMADGREPSLTSQAISAIMVHEQAESHPTVEQLRAIVEFESQVRAAQNSDIRGGLLNEKDGPLAFAVWRKPEGAGHLGLQREFRASAARGSELFAARCASCHTAGMKRWMDIGTTTHSATGGSKDLPLFRITCDEAAPPHPRLGRAFYTQDPGRALITGKCADVGAVVPQQLKGLAARAPYFSNGSARTLRDVVEFYGPNYTEQEKDDLVNFLRVL